jgi:hypothetical protein
MTARGAPTEWGLKKWFYDSTVSKQMANNKIRHKTKTTLMIIPHYVGHTTENRV